MECSYAVILPKASTPGFSLRNWRQHLFRPVDIASLVYFRITFGLLMLFETVVNFERFNYSRFWSDPEPLMHFKYYGFGWVDAIPVWDMELHVLGLQILAVFIVLGFFYRASIFLFFLGFTYFFLLDQGLYDNHHYLICWVSFAMIFMPASGSFSIDAWWRKSVRCDTTPAWTIAILAGLMGILYFYAGIAKINSDWLQGKSAPIMIMIKMAYSKVLCPFCLFLIKYLSIELSS